jgi:IS605 OrfB family transposase
MLTYKLKIKNNIDVSNYCKNYSFLFKKLYTNFELSADPNFKKDLQNKYNLDSWFYTSCCVDVKTKLSQNATQEAKQLKHIENIKKELSNTKFEGKLAKRKEYRLYQKLVYLEKRHNKPIVFGDLTNLQKISYLANDKEKNRTELDNVKKAYKSQRILPIYSVGQAAYNGNRKFEFQFNKQHIFYKPNKDTKIQINYICSKNQQTVLEKLQKYLGTQALSVRLSNDFVWITFDEQKLNNYEFKKNDFIKELKILTKEQNTTEKKKEIYKKYIAEQRDRQLANKLNNRYLAVDLNPEFIGFCIVDKMLDGTIKNVHLECIDLSNLSTKLRLSSIDPKQKYQNNKRKFEICEAWKYIFKLATHYRVAHFVMEDLDFKSPTVNDNASEANRKTRNIWHRTLTTNLIQKYCNSLGIQLIDVNPAYSSFIGNIQHDYFDPINASLEIARRGIVKYNKGSSIFPVLSGKDFDTMCQFGLDVQDNITLNWIQARGHFVTSKLRYRRALDKSKVLDNYLQSFKSNIKTYSYNNNT